MPSIPFDSKSPQVHPLAFVAPDAWVIGDVTLGEGTSVFFNSVLRGDIQPITLGKNTNLQEHVLVHSSRGMSQVIIGDNVTVGHRAVLHGCKVESCCLIGIGATILDNVVIGEHCIIGAHTLITKGTTIPARSLVMGSPGRIVRSVSDDEVLELMASAAHYVELSSSYRRYFCIAPQDR